MRNIKKGTLLLLLIILLVISRRGLDRLNDRQTNNEKQIQQTEKEIPTIDKIIEIMNIKEHNDDSKAAIGVKLDDYIEVIQQNVYGKTREKHKMKVDNGRYLIGDNRKPAGWLRKQ